MTSAARDLRGNQRASDRQHRGGEIGTRLEGRAGQLGELLVVRLDEVGRGFLDHGAERCSGRVDRDARSVGAPTPAHRTDQVDIQRDTRAGRQRSGEHQPGRAAARLDHGLDQRRDISRSTVRAPGRFSFVVTPSGSVIVTLARTCPSTGTARAGTCEACSAGANGSSARQRQHGKVSEHPPRRRRERR